MDVKFYTPQEVADVLRIRVQTIYEYIRMGKLPAIRLGNRYRITETDIEKFLAYQKYIQEEGLK